MIQTITAIPQFGEHGGDVLALQKALKAKGFSPGPLDGIFGGGTRTATQKFQKKIGLTGTGVLGPKTVAALELVIHHIPSHIMQSELPHLDVKTPRKLAPALEALIDQEVWKSFKAEALKAIKAKDGNALVAIAAEALENLGIREKTNKNDGYLVELIQKISGGKRGYAWCMYAVMVCVAWAEHKIGLVSKIPSSGSCAEVRKNCPAALQIKPEESFAGAVWVWIYSDTGLGHTGVFGWWVKKLVTASLFEGNTTKGIGDDGKIDREGGGYYRTERPFVISGMRLGMVIKAFA